MKRKHNYVTVFIVCLMLVGVIFILSRASFSSPVFAGIGKSLLPVQSAFYSALRSPSFLGSSTKVKKLEEENISLKKQLVDKQALLRENRALRDQFETQGIAHRVILPAQIVGSPGFVPGTAPADFLIIDKGSKNGIVENLAVVYKDVLFGKITKVMPDVSQVTVLTHKSISFTAKTAKTNAIGIVRGGDNEIVFDHVLVSESLKKGDIVVTSNDIDQNGNGFLPNLIVGEIISVEKKPSALFQSAKLKSLVDVSSISTVFIIVKNQ